MRSRWLLFVILLGACGDDGTRGTGGAGGTGGTSGTGGMGGSGGTGGTGGGGGLNGPVLYVTSDDGSLYAFSVGTWMQLSHSTGLPLGDGVRGIDADPQNGILFIAHGPDDLGSSGHLLAWDLNQNHMVYDVTYNHGIDQLAYGGGKIYMPAGELANTTTWYVLDASTGMQVGTEAGGSYPHNTVYRNGHRYYGGRQDNFLRVLGIGAGMVGPSPSSQIGVRPFTVNAAETRVWITWTHYRGFSVGDVASGAIITSVNFGAVPASYTPTAASHGISLAPDGSEIYVLDTPNNQVRVYDGTDAPTLRATISLAHPIFPGNESPCAYDCLRDGWLLHSRDGAYVYVGDSGDVIDTRSRQIVHQIAPLAQCRHGFIEIEWSNGAVAGTTTHFGTGH